MKYIIIITIVTLSTPGKAHACQGGFKGTGKIEMKEDYSICITIKPEGQTVQNKCFDTNDKEYKEIKDHAKDLKPGGTRIFTNEDC